MSKLYNMRRILSISFSLLLLAVTNISAQIMSNPTQWYINNQIYSMRVFNGTVANSMLRKGVKGKQQRGNAGASAKTEAAPDYTVFDENQNSSLAKTYAKNSKGQNSREAEQFFTSFIDLYKQTAQKDSFPANDLAYAYEYFVVNNYLIYHDLFDLPLDKDPRARLAKDGFDRIVIMSEKKLLQVSLFQERVIYNQFKTSLSNDPEIQKMTDAQKQETTEMLAILYGINFDAYMKGIDEEDQQKTDEARRMAKEGLENLLGVSIDKIKINEVGLSL